jgi:hypothetical protein
MNMQTKQVLKAPRPRATEGKKFSLIPDFLIIGAGKSGTTSLDNYLKQHPQIFIPSFKEPNFFGYEQSTPEELKNDPEELKHYQCSVTNLDDYLKLFEKAKPVQAIGETSNAYMYHEKAADRIMYYNPGIKLIAVLRQPAERLYSRFLHLAREDRRPTQDFAECLDRDSIWWKRNDLVREGYYYKNLSKFYKMFPHENIRVILYEDFNAHPDYVLKEIYSFLGVDPEFATDLSVRYNESGIIKNKFWDKIYGQKGIVLKTVKGLLPRNIVTDLRDNIYLQKFLNKLRSGNLTKPKFDPQLKSRITNEIYGEDIRNLQKLIDRDLSHWLQRGS